MPDRFTLSYEGQEYVAERQPGSGSAPTWRITRGGAPITSFPAAPGDTSDAIRAKLVEWLRGNEGRPAADVNRQ
jgi:hypothetical protein